MRPRPSSVFLHHYHYYYFVLILISSFKSFLISKRKNKINNFSFVYSQNFPLWALSRARERKKNAIKIFGLNYGIVIIWKYFLLLRMNRSSYYKHFFNGIFFFLNIFLVYILFFHFFLANKWRNFVSLWSKT